MVFVKVIFGDSKDMHEVPSDSVNLIVTSPPYYNAPFDFPGLFKSYEDYLDLIRTVGKELYRVLQPGRVACFIAQDVRINGKLYPIVTDLIRVMVYEAGFEYQEKIIWRKPEGYIRISRRSGVLIQHPYPMYFYPDNIYEEIVILRKPGKFDSSTISKEVKEKSKIDISKFQKEKWYLSVWDITNMLPTKEWSKYTAAFPEELAERLIRLYSYVGETVLDPFLGTGTACAIAKRLGRNCIGYEIDLELKEVVEKRLGTRMKTLETYVGISDNIDILAREDAKRFRTMLREEIERRLKNKK